MIQRVVTGSSRLRKYVPMGTPISAPNTMTAVALRSARFHAFGISGAAATKSMISKSAATRRGAAMLLARGMKISAEPKPENPRAVPDMKAIVQMAIAALTLTSGGIRSGKIIRARRRRSSSLLRRRSSPPPHRFPDRSWSFRAAAWSRRWRSTSCCHRCPCLHRRRTR